MKIDFSLTHTKITHDSRWAAQEADNNSGALRKIYEIMIIFPGKPKPFHIISERACCELHTRVHTRDMKKEEKVEKWFFPSRWFHYNTSESRVRACTVIGKSFTENFHFTLESRGKILWKFTDSAFVSLAIMIIWAFPIYICRHCTSARSSLSAGCPPTLHSLQRTSPHTAAHWTKREARTHIVNKVI